MYSSTFRPLIPGTLISSTAKSKLFSLSLSTASSPLQHSVTLCPATFIYSAITSLMVTSSSKNNISAISSLLFLYEAILSQRYEFRMKFMCFFCIILSERVLSDIEFRRNFPSHKKILPLDFHTQRQDLLGFIHYKWCLKQNNYSRHHQKTLLYLLKTLN